MSLDERMAAIAQARGAEYISMIKLALKDGSVPLYADDGSPMLFDGEHFRTEGSVMMARRLRSEVQWSSQ
jgi:hypothetical protein